ncbi:MAG: hypothetical protein ACKPEY_07955 [Planctomycetota bacterium]
MLRTTVILLIVSQLLLRSLAAAHEHSHDQQEANDHDDCTTPHDCIVMIEEPSLANSSTGSHSVRIITQASLVTVAAYGTFLPVAFQLGVKQAAAFSNCGSQQLPDLPLVLRI